MNNYKSGRDTTGYLKKMGTAFKDKKVKINNNSSSSYQKSH